MTRWLLLTLGTAATVAACTMQQQGATLMKRSGASASDGGTTGTAAAPSQIIAPIIPGDVQVTLKDPAAAHEELCTADDAHPHFPDDVDKITSVFCQDKKPGGVMPTPTNFNELLKLLGLDFKDPNGGNGVGGNPAFAILGHSSALTARKISTLMPTAFIFTPPPADGSAPVGQYVAVGFDPGEEFVEVASFDPTVKVMNFYVVFFEHACSKNTGGCPNSTLMTDKLLSGWSNVRVYEDTTSLGNTIMDCHVCHQPDNSAAPFLRMQEIEAPFTHWFSTQTEGGRALLADFHKAHNGDYGGIPAALIDKSDPSKLAALIKQAGFGNQPNAFPSAAIEAEVKASAPGQPSMNTTPGKSATWQALYDRAVAGQFIATPYHDVKVTDPAKMANMTSMYQQFLAGKTTDLPDLRDVMLDDGLREMGFAPKMGVDGRTMLAQMCQECHHSKLNMDQSRERFLTDQLDQMSRAEKDLAIERLKLPVDGRLAMPPALFRTITDEERQLMIQELQK